MARKRNDDAQPASARAEEEVAGTASGPGNDWKKGMASPNPAGRPPSRRKQDLFKAMDPLAAAFIAHDTRTLARRDGDSIERIERGEAAIERLYKKAMEGDVAALRYYHERREAAYRHRREIFESNLLAAIGYRKYWLPKFDRAERSGKLVPTELPHPRDVIINPDGTVDVVGPVIDEDQEKLRQAVRKRAELRKAISLAHANLGFEGVPEKLMEFRKAWKRYNQAFPPRLHEPFPEPPDT